MCKNTGPLESILIAIATTIKRGESKIREISAIKNP